MRSGFGQIAAASVLGFSLAGCGPPWQANSKEVQVAPTEEKKWYVLGEYLPARYPLRRRYNLRDPDRQPAKPAAYPRLDTRGRRVEGIAPPEKFDRLQVYYPRLRGETGEDRPYGPFGKGGGAILEFDPSLQEFPERMQVGQTCRTQCKVKQYWANGLPAARGDLVRKVTLEDVETIKVKGGWFEECLRLRVDMDLELTLAMHLMSREYLWLAPGVGEVRRTLHVWGRTVLVAWIDQKLEYELTEIEPGPEPPPAGTPVAGRRWARVAILISWRGLAPYPSGMVFEYTPGRETDADPSSWAGAKKKSLPIVDESLKWRYI